MLNILKNKFLSLNTRIKTCASECERQIVPFGIFGLAAYPVFAVLNAYVLSPKHYENLALRLAASLLCLLLALKPYWPAALKRFIPIYWYLSLIYCIPFFFVYMLLKNHISNDWLLNLLTVVFVAILILDWLNAIVIFTIGSLFGVISFYLTAPTPFSYQPGTISFSDFVGAFVVTLIWAVLFSRNKQIAEREKIATMNELSANVAHELRTPLASISAQIVGLRQWLPTLLATYQKASQHQLATKTIGPRQMMHLGQSPEKIKAEVSASFHFIDMLLVSAKQPSASKSEERFSIADSINNALTRYPFQGDQRDLVNFDAKDDFIVQANSLLINHVIFNLLKNALHHINAKAGEPGNITIKLDQQTRQIHFKDTGTGIDSKDLRHVFDRFYSKTHHGTGIGLAFCKSAMENLGGKIVCHSVKNEFTEFVLTFPPLKKETQ